MDRTQIFPGDSEMAGRMRAFEWSTSDLGSPGIWPDHLRIALSICLTSRFPMQVWWGPNLTMLYNDAYIPFLGGGKHPRALGHSAREIWSEIWHQIGPMLDQVVTAGTASWSEDIQMFFNRKTPQEEVFVSFSFSPIFEARGSVGGKVDGVFCACTETTAKVLGARQLEARARELAESEDRYRSLFESAPMAVFVCDRRAVIQYFNARAVELWGREPVCGVEKHCGSMKLWLPDGTLLPHDQSPMVEVLRTGIPAHNVEVFSERPDGSRLPVLVDFAALKDAQGNITGAITSFVDITDRKQAEATLRESEERFRTLAENMSQFAWTADAKGWIYWYNQRWYDYTGTTLEDMQGWGWKAVHHPDHLDRVVERLQHSWDTGEVWEDTFPLRGKDGQYRWFLSRARPIRDAAGQVVRWLGTNTDVTEQLAAEDALKESDRHKNDFLAMLAHELRNPLAPIRSGLQIMKKTQGNGEAAQSASAMMERQIGHMVRLVDDLLDVSRISRGTIELRRERVELASIIEQAVEACSPAIDGGRHELVVALPPQPVFLHADSVRLAQVFSNLLNNAAKYSEPRGHISLTAELQGGDVAVAVRDTGFGIASDMLPRIFEMFTQVDQSLERSQGGLGIGLALVRTLVGSHGGSVEARSAGIGQGSEFVVRLPAMAQAAAPGPGTPEPAEPAAATPLRILVVDDNLDAAQSLAMLLQLHGHETHLAHDGLEAVEAAARLQPDVVLLDIGLPRLNGYEAARRIREHQGAKRALLVALTGWGQDDDRRHSKDAGFDAHMTKPVDNRALMKTLVELRAR